MRLSATYSPTVAASVAPDSRSSALLGAFSLAKGKSRPQEVFDESGNAVPLTKNLPPPNSFSVSRWNCLENETILVFITSTFLPPILSPFYARPQLNVALCPLVKSNLNKWQYIRMFELQRLVAQCHRNAREGIAQTLVRCNQRERTFL